MKVLLQICGAGRRVICDILLPAAIVFLIVAVGYYLLMKFAPEADKVANEFSVFVKLLGIILTVLIGIGIAIFWSIRKLTKESVEEDMRKRFSEIRGKLAISGGFTFYILKQYDLAIIRTKQALGEKLEELDEVWAKNNLAYYYAIKHKQHALSEAERKEAEIWVKFVYGKYDRWKKGFNQPEWVETYTFVMSRFAKGKQQRKEIKQEISDILKRPEFTQIKKDLKNNLKYLNSKIREGN